MQWPEADAALAAELGAALGDVKIIAVPCWGEILPGPVTDDLYFGSLALGVRASPPPLAAAPRRCPQPRRGVGSRDQRDRDRAAVRARRRSGPTARRNMAGRREREP